MPIKDLQAQQAQVGRIRIGHQVETKDGKTRPAKLDRFRFTTPSQTLAKAIAAQYGGTVEPWQAPSGPAEWEVISDAKAIPVLVPPRPVSQFYELWSGAGCQRRCDGETEIISGDACQCPLDQLERAELATKGRACKVTTRLKVMLPEIPGIGVWRLDSHGYYSAIELPSTAEFLGAVTDAGGYIRAVLALEERIVKRPGVGIRQFMVPALHVDVTPDALVAGAGTALPGRATAAIAGGAGQPVSSGAAALEAGSSQEQREEAQALAEEAARTTDRDVIRTMWKDCGDRDLLSIEVTVDDKTGALGALLQHRGALLKSAAESAGDPGVVEGEVQSEEPAAPPAAAADAPVPSAAPEPAAPPAAAEPPAASLDDLYVDIVSAASMLPEDLDVDAEFARFSGGAAVGTATSEQLQAFLEEIQRRATDAAMAGA